MCPSSGEQFNARYGSKRLRQIRPGKGGPQMLREELRHKG